MIQKQICLRADRHNLLCMSCFSFCWGPIQCRHGRFTVVLIHGKYWYPSCIVIIDSVFSILSHSFINRHAHLHLLDPINSQGYYLDRCHQVWTSPSGGWHLCTWHMVTWLSGSLNALDQVANLGSHLVKWTCVTCTSANLHLVKCTFNDT